MKSILLFVFIFISAHAFAQPYALLDKNMIAPAKYSTTFTTLDRKIGYFPVEKKSLAAFILALKEISKAVSSKTRLTSVKQYQIGCVKFQGELIPLDKGDKINYMLTSTCSGTITQMHLIDLKIGKESNIYFINTWIKYIESTLK